MKFLPIWLQLKLGVATVDGVTKSLSRMVDNLSTLATKLNAESCAAAGEAARLQARSEQLRLEEYRALQRAEKIKDAFLFDS